MVALSGEVDDDVDDFCFTLCHFVFFVCSIEVSVHYNACLTWMQWVVLVSLLCYYVYSSACDVVLVLLYLVSIATMKIEFFSSTWFVCWVS